MLHRRLIEDDQGDEGIVQHIDPYDMSPVADHTVIPTSLLGFFDDDMAIAE